MDERLQAFAHPSVHLALWYAIEDLTGDCQQYASWGDTKGNIYLGRAAELDALRTALRVCHEILMEKITGYREGSVLDPRD